MRGKETQELMILLPGDVDNNILYSSEWEIKAVVGSFTLMRNRDLKCKYLHK